MITERDRPTIGQVTCPMWTSWPWSPRSARSNMDDHHTAKSERRSPARPGRIETSRRRGPISSGCRISRTSRPGAASCTSPVVDVFAHASSAGASPRPWRPTLCSTRSSKRSTTAAASPSMASSTTEIAAVSVDALHRPATEAASSRRSGAAGIPDCEHDGGAVRPGLSPAYEDFCPGVDLSVWGVK